MSVSPSSPRISIPVDHALRDATARAQQGRHEFVRLEHLLWGLMCLPEVIDMVQNMGADSEAMRKSLEEHLSASDRTQAEAPDYEEPHLTVGVGRVLRRALDTARMRHEGLGVQPIVSTDIVLINMLLEVDSFAVNVLARHKITAERLKILISHGPERLQRMEAEAVSTQDTPPKESPSKGLKEFAVNLNIRAKRGRIDPLIGRASEVRRAAQILGRRRKNNPILVGEPGVGKTAIAEGLARQIVEGHAPPTLAKKEIWALDLGAMVAGTKYRGDFEKRIKSVIEEASRNPKVVLFIDEIHNLVGAGSGSGAMDASNILKPALASGDLNVIGATTFKEFRRVFEKDSALARRFQKIDIAEPSADDTRAIVQGLRKRLEKYHNVRFDDDVLDASVALSGRFLADRAWPDKAIDVLDEAASACVIDAKTLDSTQKNQRLKVDIQTLQRVVANMAGLPPDQVAAERDDKAAAERLQGLDTAIKTHVFGQDDAVDVLTDAVQIAKAGLANPRHPLGSYLFAGPTGVGKTELARQLAERMALPLIRFDMSEYQEAHTVSRLIGAPPGYVGSDKGGLLTDAVARQPHAVVLLDEIEKAHPDIYNVLLQVMDDGTLTDTDGRKINFRNVFVIMTTNAGAHEALRPSMGFVENDRTTDASLVLEKAFPPEFRNRLDAVVSFKALTHDAVARVVDKEIAALADQLAPRDVILDVDTATRERWAKEGYSPAMGARPMARLIHDQLKKSLAKAMLFGKLSDGGIAHVVSDEEGNTVLDCESMVRKAKTAVNKQGSPDEKTRLDQEEVLEDTDQALDEDPAQVKPSPRKPPRP